MNSDIAASPIDMWIVKRANNGLKFNRVTEMSIEYLDLKKMEIQIELNCKLFH